MNSRHDVLTRRDALKNLAGFGAAALAGDVFGADATPDLIRMENAKPGTRDWLLTNTRIDPATKFRCPWIEGYCSRTSVRAGESIAFHVSTNPPSAFTLELFRLGFYNGDGGRLVHRFATFEGKTQPDPPVGPKRVRDCAWEPCAEFKIPEDWVSGVNLGKLTAAESGVQSYVIFIVRDDRRADFLFQCSDTTWQAYNRWPSQFALYDDGTHEWFWGGDVQVSFNRPYGKYCQIFDAPLSTGSGEFLLWEFPLAFWMESLGYNVTYISNLDTHADADGLLRAKGFLSIGHDEYWSIEMFEHVTRAISRGASAAFFSGNAVCGRILFDGKARAFERVGVPVLAAQGRGWWGRQEVQDLLHHLRLVLNPRDEEAVFGALASPLASPSGGLSPDALALLAFDRAERGDHAWDAAERAQGPAATWSFTIK